LGKSTRYLPVNVGILSLFCLLQAACGGGFSQLSSQKEITSFVVLGHEGVIGMDAIQAVVPAGTALNHLAPTITYDGKGIQPASGAYQDFSRPVVYTVTAEDFSTKAYAATILAAVCGNGVLEPGEECDDGNLVNRDGCSSACKLPACGDGYLDLGEQCDDGNLVDGDGCSSTCQVETLATCGDGVVQAGEQCDDGNQSNNDACLNNCQLASCGDGFVQAGVEQCDDGNKVNGDGCSSTCMVEA